MKINNIISLMIILWVIISCSSSHKIVLNDFHGVYLSKNEEDKQLILREKSFIHTKIEKERDLAVFKCCDTLAYGNWKIDKKSSLIVLNSAKKLNNSHLNINVQEIVEPSRDSISFFIDNPIEKHYKKFGEKYREVYYSVTLNTNDDFFIKTSDSNPIIMKKVNGIKMIEIAIYPKYDIPIRNVAIREVYTVPYEIQNPETTVFKIVIPQLDYGFFSYKRLHNDYIKVNTKNKLTWDGEEYIKQ